MFTTGLILLSRDPMIVIFASCGTRQKIVRGIPPLCLLLVLSISRETVITLFTKRIRMRRASIQILYKKITSYEKKDIL
jgi:hypothetical protein